MPGHRVLQRVDSTTKPLYSASKASLKTQAQTTLDLQLLYASFKPLFSVGNSLVNNVLINTTFIDECILEILPE